MFHTNHGFKNGFLSALNRCVATSFFTAANKAGQNTKNPPVFEMVARVPRNPAQEKYLAIPTFIRQGKTLGL
ncbi:MAG: hypothetical protein KKH22_07965 [Proteobacteria bacterium]|nr:hypothetical protein [Pseudomonadota bacterium]